MGRLHPPSLPWPATSTAPALPGRRGLLRLGGAALAGAVAGCASRGPQPPVRSEVVPFSTSSHFGALPDGWRMHVTRPDRPVTGYRLAQIDDRVALHALSLNGTSGVRCDVDIDLAARPWLRWSWRVDQMADEATVADDDLDDSPARVVLGFAGDNSRLSLRDRLFADQVELFTGAVLPYATLCYVWDGRVAPEAVLPYARSSRIRYLVVESGRGGLGRWQAYRRNVAADYQRVFGEAPGRLVGAGVLTDSDDLKGHAEAWYGDLVVE